MAAVSGMFRRLVTVLQSTPTSTIPLDYPLFHLEIRTTVCHVISLDSVPPQNAACTLATTFCQLAVSGVLSQVLAISHWRRCSSLIYDGPPERFRQSLHTVQVISSSSGMESSTGNGCTLTGIVCPGGGTCRYISTRSAFMVAMTTLTGVRRQSTTSLYHSFMQIHASQMRGKSEARRDSTADPALATLWRWSSWRFALIVRLSALEL